MQFKNKLEEIIPPSENKICPLWGCNIYPRAGHSEVLLKKIAPKIAHARPTMRAKQDDQVPQTVTT